MAGMVNSAYSNVTFALHLHTEALIRLQEQASTGSRINRVSDEPSTAYQVLGLDSQQRSLEKYMDSIVGMTNTLAVVSTTISEVQFAISDIKTDMTQITSTMFSQDQRTTMAGGVNEALENIVSLVNGRNGNQYLFGGSDTTSAPYTVTRTNGLITAVTYQGSSDVLNVEVADGIESSAFYVGDDVFRSNNRGDPVFIGDTGAAAGSGTSSVRGDVWLTVADDGGGSYDLSIGDGTPVNVAAASDPANIAVTNSAGEVLYVDGTSIAGTGVDMVRMPGTYDVFNMLISIRDILKNERGLSNDQSKEVRDSTLNSLIEMESFLTNKMASVGSREGFLEGLRESLENMKLDTADQATYLQEADITEIAINLSRREILYQMSLAVAGRLMSVSLLDFIG